MKRHKRYFAAAVAVAVACLVVVLTPVGPAVAESMKPILTIDLENPARRAFEQNVDCEMEGGDLNCSADLTAPSGKLLVVETVTAMAVLPPYGQSAIVTATNLSTGVVHRFALVRQGVCGTQELLIGTHPIRLYVALTATLRLTLFRTDATASAGLAAAVSGHLVDCGPGPGCPIP